ncbi:MAG: helix-turn-helix domain-containing protein [Polaribacter sp.]|nr:helix-turn-helix domain-containing protein [Polaribacter sp.]
MEENYRLFWEDDYQKILQLIAKKRIEKKLTQWDVSKRLGLSESGYFKIEKGTSRLDMIRFLTLINILETSPIDFFQELEKTTPLKKIR